MPFQKGHPGGPGRPPTRKTHAGAVRKAEKQIVDRLPQLVDNMIVLANGGYERVEEVWARADSLYIGSGTDARRMYPDAKDDEQILVKRTTSVADRDRAANIYLIDRILGKPTERKEHSFPKPLEEMTDDELQAILNS